ncbi:MAG: hypothetical protein K2Q32_00170, partial [Alphaproteobacteria bacterium]|nr:hypothetical protein [Alphaproteobacteria bacterium]
PVHNIRERDTALGLYHALQKFNDERLAWLVAHSGGQDRFDALQKSNPDFADAIRILARPKVFDDLVYLPVEAGHKHTCLFTELHDVVPHIADDIVTGISLSKIGMAGLRSGAVFVFNKALAKRISKIFTLSVEGMNFSSFIPLTLLDKRHPNNAALRQSIMDYGDDLYVRSAYFSALFQGRTASRLLLKALPKLHRLLRSAVDPLTQQPLTLGAIPGVELLDRDAAGYFTNIHIDMKVWGKIIDTYFPTRKADGMSDLTAIHTIVKDQTKILVMPIALHDRDGAAMAVSRMNCHTSFDNLTGVYARLRHMAESHGLMPASTQQLKMSPHHAPQRPIAAQDNLPPPTTSGTDVA